MKKCFLFFILFILVNLAANAQQEPLFSNYMLLKPIANAGAVGAGNTINAMFVNRSMFSGLTDGAPVTSVFGMEAPVRIFGTNSGLGIVIMSDEIGFSSNVNVDFSYAYHHSFETGTLGGGIKIGFNNYSIVPEWVDLGSDESGIFTSPTSDPSVPDQFSTMTMSVGLGLYYETPQYYFGFSASQLNQSDIVYAVSGESDQTVGYYPATYYLSGGYNIELPDPLFDLQPSFILRSDLASFSLDVNGTLYFKEKYWAGGGFRVAPQSLAALTFLGGMKLMNGLNLGYALDINTSSIFISGGALSHEIMVSYSFNLDTKRDQKYKSIRFL
jgi:type IX secretion system PorP/SprF family membrane protein